MDEKDKEEILGLLSSILLRVSRIERRIDLIEREFSQIAPDRNISHEINKIRRTLYKGNGKRPLVESVDKILVQSIFTERLQKGLSTIKQIFISILMLAGMALLYAILQYFDIG